MDVDPYHGWILEWGFHTSLLQIRIRIIVISVESGFRSHTDFNPEPTKVKKSISFENNYRTLKFFYKKRTK